MVSAFPPFMEQSYQLLTYSFLLGPKLFSETLTREKMNGFNMNTAQFSIPNEEAGSGKQA